MKLPGDLPLRGVMFLDGAKGMATQVYKNDEYGLTVCKGRPDRDTPFALVISMAGVEGKFATFEELNAAIADVDRDQLDYVRQLESVNAPADEIEEAKKGGRDGERQT